MYGYENYRKVKDILRARREGAIGAAEGRTLEVCSKSPRFAEIEKELRSTGLLLFKTACAGGDIEPIKKRNTELLNERSKILAELGYPEDYTDAKYTCTICNDTGCDAEKMCRCMRELIITENIKSSGMGALIEKQSFDNFDLDRYKKDSDEYKIMKYNYQTARLFAEKFGESGIHTLLFTGKTGTGKTHLSTAIARVVIERGFEVLYDSTQNVVSAFETDRFRSGYGQYEPQGDKFLDCDLLILDDLGAEFTNQFTVSCLYNLINTRQNKGLATVISTNLSGAELKNKYESRIYSRLLGTGSITLSFVGDDYRLK